MKKTTKSLSVFLALLMVISIIPMSTIVANATDSGVCGNNLTWVFDDETDTLTVSGVGAMYDYSSDNRPWEKYEDNIENVVIDNHVTTIGNYAFYDCESLNTIKLGSRLTQIGNWAFGGCYDLTRVTFPNSVITIGSYAFCDCERLTNVTFGNGVTTINAGAFQNCYGIVNITIPNSVTSIGYSAFYGCNNLKNVVIGNGVTKINSYTFYGCADLNSVTIPDSVTKIGEAAFYDCVNLKYVYYEGNEQDWGKISVDKNNEAVINATFTYEYTKTENFTGVKGDYFYKNGVRQSAYQVVEFAGNYYFISDSHKIAKNKRIYLSEKFLKNTCFEAGYYNFDADGKMLVNGPNGDYFYIDTVRQPAYQLVEFEGNFYFINDCHKLAKNKRIYLSERFVDGITYPDGTPIKPGYYNFDIDGKMVFNGPIGDYFYKEGVRQNAYQLVEYEGNFYFINDNHKLAKNKTVYLSEKVIAGITYSDGTPIKSGYYSFDANGKMLINGVIDGYLYKDSVKQRAYQLVELDGYFYFVNNGNKVAKNQKIYLSERFVEGFTYSDGTPFKPGYYSFDADGKMMITGPIGDYFYKDGVRQEGYFLVSFQGNYYYVGAYNKLVKNKTFHLGSDSLYGTGLKAGYYSFNADGKMIIE